MGKGGELWDDSALVDAFDRAVATYKVRLLVTGPDGFADRRLSAQLLLGFRVLRASRDVLEWAGYVVGGWSGRWGGRWRFRLGVGELSRFCFIGFVLTNSFIGNIMFVYLPFLPLVGMFACIGLMLLICRKCMARATGQRHVRMKSLLQLLLQK